MHDYREAAERVLIRDLATDRVKRATFDRLTAHLIRLVDKVELKMLNRRAVEQQ